MIFSFISFVHSKVMQSCSQAYMHIYTYMHTCTDAFTHTCIHAFMHFISFHFISCHFISFIHPVIQPFNSLIYSFIRSFSDPFIHSFICLFVLVTQSFLHLTPSIHSIKRLYYRPFITYIWMCIPVGKRSITPV